MAGMAGSALTVIYSAGEAFEQMLAEGLWSELQPHGVDVLALVAGATSLRPFSAPRSTSIRTTRRWHLTTL
jgi:short-subunit dehydrogenase